MTRSTQGSARPPVPAGGEVAPGDQQVQGRPGAVEEGAGEHHLKKGQFPWQQAQTNSIPVEHVTDQKVHEEH
jgi:hypothetical protein